MTLAEHVRTLGRGPGRSRSLTRVEAEDAMGHMLRPDTAPEAVGALLMLLRMKGETDQEIAGLAGAARASLPAMPKADLDWPSYAAGRTRGPPWFLLSARLVSQAGYRVVMHGWNGPDASVRNGLADAGIPTARLAELSGAAQGQPIVYVPLEDLSPALFRLLSLRSVLGLRSCINTVCRMLNPSGAGASVQGVFHPSYRLLQADAARLLGWQALTVIKGGGGEFERHPAKRIAAFGLRRTRAWDATYPERMDEKRRLDDGLRDASALSALWRGELSDPFAEEIVIGTASLALDTLGAPEPHKYAERLWLNRLETVNAA